LGEQGGAALVRRRLTPHPAGEAPATLSRKGRGAEDNRAMTIPRDSVRPAGNAMSQQGTTAATSEPRPAAPTTAPGGLALVAVQLALVLLVVRNYEIGSRLHFFPVQCVAGAGWLVHVCL